MNNLERIQRLRLLDDDFMRVIFQDWNCCQLFLEILLGRNDIKNRRFVWMYGFIQIKTKRSMWKYKEMKRGHILSELDIMRV